MPKIDIDDIAAIGPELNEGDLRLVNGGLKRETSSWVMDWESGRTWSDADF
ncbi:MULTISPECIES: putative ATP-grasp target RiPP [unclassified Nonomuraea]|uniref:putative ATP-grasp target RiPP n=1 Tax=unclassified Nonomuraea TaxID=2593643 RepID=UPI003411B282